MCWVGVPVHLCVDRQPVTFICVRRAHFVKVQQLCTWATFFTVSTLCSLWFGAVQDLVGCGPGSRPATCVIFWPPWMAHRSLCCAMHCIPFWFRVLQSPVMIVCCKNEPRREPQADYELWLTSSCQGCICISTCTQVPAGWHTPYCRAVT